MVQVFTKEWQITKTYIYDVAMINGLINLDWDNFEAFADDCRPLVAVKNEGDASVGELVQEALDEVRVYGEDKISHIILSISRKEIAGIDMEEMSAVNDCLSVFDDMDMEIKWGVSQNDSMESMYRVCVFAFG